MQTALWTMLTVAGITTIVSIAVAAMIKGLHFITRRVIGTNHDKRP